MSDMGTLIASGAVSTVGDILGQIDEPSAQIERVTPPRLDGQPAFPEPGIYFGMPETDYHAINAFSASLCKDMTVSPMYAWAKSPLNPDREDDDSVAKTLGRAYHVRICEGRAAYERCYAVELDKADYPDALVTVDEIKAAIAKCAVEPYRRVDDHGTMRAAKKEDWIEQLSAVNPTAQVWERIAADHAAANAGRILIRAQDDKRIQVAARMIENDPELSKAFSGGFAEVSLFWYDAKTGAPCKARIDYLKMNAFVDLKSFSLKVERPVDRAIDFEIASRKHYIPVAHYSDGIAAVKALVRADSGNAVRCPEEWHVDTMGVATRWAERWANVQDDPAALYVFQATGIAPITRGKILHRGTVFAVTKMAVEMMRKRYVDCVQAFGADPWIDSAPISQLTDESIPLSATDFGEQ